MALTRKVTVTLPAEQLSQIRDLVGLGQTDSVSGFVSNAVALALEERAAFESLLSAALEKTGGPMTAKERRWADAVLRGGTG